MARRGKGQNWFGKLLDRVTEFLTKRDQIDCKGVVPRTRANGGGRAVDTGLVSTLP